MKAWFSHIGCKVLIGLLAVQTFNLSINSLEFYKAETANGSLEQSDYVDSMVEFLVENVLNFSSHTFHLKWSSSSSSRPQTAQHYQLKWYATQLFVAYNPMVFYKSQNVLPRNEALINLYFEEVPVKPPQA